MGAEEEGRAHRKNGKSVLHVPHSFQASHSDRGLLPLCGDSQTRCSFQMAELLAGIRRSLSPVEGGML